MSRLPHLKLFACPLLALAIASCQSTPPRSTELDARTLSDSLPTRCAADLRAFREVVEAEGVVNAGAPALALFPFLHSNRFLHALADAAATDKQVSEWTQLASNLGAEIRASENRNLRSPWSDRDLSELAECSSVFARSMEYRDERHAALDAVRGSNFPASYQTGRQILGALPLLRPFLKQRILAEHVRERSLFSAENNFARSNFYRAQDTESGAANPEAWLQAAYEDSPLRLPLLSDAQLATLFAQHAPTLQIEMVDENDKIGEPRWRADAVQIDTRNPVVYTLPTLTRFEGRNLLQLNYVFWFSERKPRRAIDLYAGAIDSIIWRVTLDESGQVLLYDSIHSCGCYHKYFVVADELVVREQPASREPANIFTLAGSALQRGPMLSISANEHYIVGVTASPDRTPVNAQPQTYRFVDYPQLQNLSDGRGSRSLFDANGLIPGSERLERFTLWPTGILSVGAMRQWGTHATGFIEEQHFDDAHLFEYYFESASTAQSERR